MKGGMNMKLRYLFFFLILVSLTNFSVGQDYIKLDPQSQQIDYVPGQILVKFKDDVIISAETAEKFAKVNIASIDEIFQEFKIYKVTKLFRGAKRLLKPKTLKSFSGETFLQPNLHNIYKLELKDPSQMFEAIERLKKDQNVEYAEPNYIFSVVDAKPVSDVLSEDDLKSYQKVSTPNQATGLVPNDPLYSQQWYIPAIRADAVWNSTTGDTTQIIGVLDTGVDWLHPDLANNIWVNYSELNGIPGIDDDRNGFIDDIHGWDFINNDNDPRDDNSHGTHVAGIISAVGNNGIGIAGVNWHAKIMPIKVFQSSGRGDVATITQGIWYAINKGATILNMSFGSYARSLTMEDALAYAYAQAVLVAAAGNDGIGINISPFYPAALSYVLGVQDRAGYSNFDEDGPVFSRYPDLLNYELYAPGSGIISTIPNGNYRSYTGTSMATAVASGAISLYKTIFPDQSQEIMWGNLINTISVNIDLFAALQVKAKPILWFVSQTIVDTLDGDRDGRVDAGETIEIWFMVRNTWGHADSVFVAIRFGEFEDTTTAQIIKSVGFVGSIGPYAKRSNENDPLLIKINPNLAHDRDIVFEALLWYQGSQDTVKQRIVLTVENGEELAGVIDSTIILTPDKLWLINNSLRIGYNGTLIIKPGTKIIVYPGQSIVVRGSVYAIGTPDSMIIIRGPGMGFLIDGYNSSAQRIFKYCRFEYMQRPISFASDWSFSGPYADVENCQFVEIQGGDFGPFGAIAGIRHFRNNEIKNSFGGWMLLSIVTGELVKNNFIKALAPGNSDRTMLNMNPRYYSKVPEKMKFNNFAKSGGIFIGPGNFLDEFSDNNFISPNTMAVFTDFWTSQDIQRFPNQYWGTTDSAKIQKMIYDFWDDPRFPLLDVRPIRTAPSDSAHGIVWKVLVNGKDAQDEYRLLNPVGVGPVRFDVYFNRPMDTTYTPQLSFGVREPYTQNFVRDSARWSPDGRIWTAYTTIKINTGDGINRIRVAGARDPEGFEIPVEDTRFNFIISAAASASAGFSATPGLGKITLQWEKPELTDILGFNLYRFTNITDTTFSQPQLINTTLILDTFYTDFNVIPNKRYYYYYKIVRTNFSETDSSKVVSAIPFTSTKGDVNGDLTVNVLDVVATVSYILGQNPQPFIFEAADVNNDSLINILDIVGIINIILNTNVQTMSLTSSNAKLELINDRLELTTDVPISGIQFQLEGQNVQKLKFIQQGVLSNFEIVNGMHEDSTRIYLIFNLNGSTLPIGRYTLGTFQEMQPNIQLTKAILSDPAGKNVITSVYNNGSPLIPTEYYLNQNYPNPFNSTTTIEFGLPEKTDVTIAIYNVLGQLVREYRLGEMNPGRYKIQWDGRNQMGNIVASGVYFYRMHTPQFTKVRKLVLIK
jgi:hypothetical protein